MRVLAETGEGAIKTAPFHYGKRGSRFTLQFVEEQSPGRRCDSSSLGSPRLTVGAYRLSAINDFMRLCSQPFFVPFNHAYRPGTVLEI